jgi:REP element-mobilizing transposase RayT
MIRLTALLPSAALVCRETVHFATWRISSWQQPLSEAERGTVTAVLHQRKDQRCELLAFVVMDDHVHVLVRCGEVPANRVVETMKSFTAHSLRELHARSGAVWQRETFHRRVVDENDLRARSHYIAANPWKRWPFVERYPWVWEAGRQAQAWRDSRPGLAGSLARVMATVRH